jgi:hypothetical protein
MNAPAACVSGHSFPLVFLAQRLAPSEASAGAIERAGPLRHNAFGAARMPQDRLAILAELFTKHEACQGGPQIASSVPTGQPRM